MWAAAINNKLKNNKIIAVIKDIILVILISTVISYLIGLIVKPVTVVGNSMNPTLRSGDLLLMNRKAYVGTSIPKYGDIVVVTLRNNDNEKYSIVKRIIGAPGDTIELSEDGIYRNDKLLNESYLPEEIAPYNSLRVTLKEDEIFIMGDNRNISLDSRDSRVGIINYKEQVRGKIEFKMCRSK